MIEPFTAHIDEDDLYDVRRRLAATRWAPEQPAGTGDGAHGVPVSRVRRLAARWREFDWRGCEDRLNAYPQFRMATSARFAASPSETTPGSPRGPACRG